MRSLLAETEAIRRASYHQLTLCQLALCNVDVDESVSQRVA